MNGYMIHHELAINRQAAALCKLAAEYQNVIAEGESLLKIPGWDTPAADAQRTAIQKTLGEAYNAAAALRQLSDELYAFTESHKTWLEEIIDAITPGE